MKPETFLAAVWDKLPPAPEDHLPRLNKRWAVDLAPLLALIEGHTSHRRRPSSHSNAPWRTQARGVNPHLFPPMYGWAVDLAG
jgi:hypothetical protein